MITSHRKSSWLVAAATLALSFSSVRGASLYLSAVAENFSPGATTFVADSSRAVTYAAIDAGYIESGDPVGGIKPAPALLIQSAVAQALAQRGYQPATAGSAPALLIVYSWGEIRHDSFQVQPTDHFKGNDRTRLLLMTTSADAKDIEQDLVNDRFSLVKAGRLALTATQRDSLELSHDDLYFVVISAFDASALRGHKQTPVWQVRLATRAIGHSMGDALVSLIHYGTPYLGRNERYRQDLHEAVVPANSVRVESAVPGLNTTLEGADPALVQSIVKSEHAMWSGNYHD